MKKIVSTQGLLSGKFDAPLTNTAIHERVDNKLMCYYKHDLDDDIQAVSSFTYEVEDGQVIVIEFSYTIDNPTPERLEDFRFICECFYGLNGFKVDADNNSPRVYFRATDIFDMASLIHALEYLSVSLESVMCALDAELTENSPLQVKAWDTHYDETSADDIEKEYELAMRDVIFDEYDVGYSKDNKILKFCRYTFNEAHYEVPDGVEVIESCAFVGCRHFLELSIPKSVRTIGDFIFGYGGVIKIREK